MKKYKQTMMTKPQETLALKIIDTWLDYRFRYGDLPGFQVCVRKKGQILFSKAYGYTNLDSKQPLNTKDLFRIASQSKSFTACAFLMLQEQGKINLEETALAYLPELKHHKDKRFKKITIRDFLTHRSGLFRDGLDASFFCLEESFLSRDQLIQETLSSKLIYDPNTNTKYSNVGYALLGMILENIMGASFDKIVKNLIIKQLSNDQIFSDYSKNLQTHLANGHSRPIKRKRFPVTHSPALSMAPATGFCANAESASLFYHHFLLGNGLIENTTQRELLSLNWPIKNAAAQRYGLGLHFDKFAEIELIGHSGGYPGFVSQTRHWLGTDYVISFFINANDSASLSATRSIVSILDFTAKHLSEEKRSQIIVTSPLMNLWMGALFAITSKKGFYLNIDSWLPCEGALFLQANKEGSYLCPKESGTEYVGEQVFFIKDKSGDISSVKWGPFSFHKENVFLKKFEEKTKKS